MPDLSILATGRPYHVLSYGTLLGCQVFQSFINGIVAYTVLPRAQFSTLQTALFPVYFGLQTALPVLLALTYPAASSPFGASNPAGISGLLREQKRYGALVPIATIFATGVANLLYIGPLTTKVMRERKHQETRDGKKYDVEPKSKEMLRLNKRFGGLHGVSSGLNLAALIATIWYGVTLSERIG